MATLDLLIPAIPNYRRPGTVARLRVWFTQDFDTAEDLHVMGGAVRSTAFFLDVACSVDLSTHALTIPTISLPTTNDSSVPNVRATAVLFDASGALARNLFTNYIIPSQLAPSTSLAALNDYNAASPQPPNPTYPSTDQIITLIDDRIEDFGNLAGTLTANRVPRAATESTLVDGQILDDGQTVQIETLNTFEVGDLNESQNGSYILLNDTESRVSFQAGGEGNSRYAGISAVASQGKDEFYIQGSHGNGINYGVFSEGVAKVGDSLAQNNGTYLEIDDVQEVIRLHNLPTSDPGIANALWKSGEDLKISQGQPSSSASPSSSPSASPSSSVSSSPSAS